MSCALHFFPLVNWSASFLKLQYGFTHVVEVVCDWPFGLHADLQQIGDQTFNFYIYLLYIDCTIDLMIHAAWVGISYYACNK